MRLNDLRIDCSYKKWLPATVKILSFLGYFGILKFLFVIKTDTKLV